MKPSRFFLPLVATTVVAGAAPAQIFQRPSIEQQIKLGRQAGDEIRRKERVLPSSDPRVQLVRRIGARLVRTLPANDPWQYSFDVVDSAELNAFALPGGSTFINSGLLAKCTTEDQIAGVFGHEIAHVRDQHWASRVKVQQERQGLALLAGLFLRVNPNVLGVADLLNGLNTLQFSRRDETKADDMGYTMMVNAGYNPEGLIGVFQILSEGSRGGGPEWLRTHPDPGNRLRRLRDKINANRRDYPNPIPLDEEIRRLPVYQDPKGRRN